MKQQQVPESPQALHEKLLVYSALYWSEQIKLLIGGQPFNIQDHPYQVDSLNSRDRVEVFKCSTQTGKTITQIIKRIHRLIHGEYPQGSMFIFPTTKLVRRFSQSRFTPLIDDNPEIARHIPKTDNIELKRVGKSNLYFVGGKVLQKIEGEIQTSAALKSEPVDNLNFDELDEISDTMIEMALHRIDHSEIKDVSYSGSPSMPDYGIDAKYNESDQRVWMIKCQKCNELTCLELEFPECIVVRDDGTAYRKCRKCGGVIHPRDGRWVAQYPGRSMVGRWISRLNLADKYVDLADIVRRFMDPPNGNIGDVYNHDLGMAYVSAENRLRKQDLEQCLTGELMRVAHPGPTAMGVDLGKDFHVVILDKPFERVVRLVKAVRIPAKKNKDDNVIDMSPLHKLAQEFNVGCCVIDFAPEQQKVRDFRADEDFDVYGCIYQEHQRGTVSWDSLEGIVRVNRTEIHDATHDIVARQRLMLPRKSEEIDEFIREYCCTAKKLEEDESTGSKEYRYIKLGADHYRHATNYAYLAWKRVGVYVSRGRNGRRSVDGWDDDAPARAGSWMGS